MSEISTIFNVYDHLDKFKYVITLDQFKNYLHLLTGGISSINFKYIMYGSTLFDLLTEQSHLNHCIIHMIVQDDQCLLLLKRMFNSYENVNDYYIFYTQLSIIKIHKIKPLDQNTSKSIEFNIENIMILYQPSNDNLIFYDGSNLLIDQKCSFIDDHVSIPLIDPFIYSNNDKIREPLLDTIIIDNNIQKFMKYLKDPNKKFTENNFINMCQLNRIEIIKKSKKYIQSSWINRLVGIAVAKKYQELITLLVDLVDCHNYIEIPLELLNISIQKENLHLFTCLLKKNANIPQKFIYNLIDRFNLPFIQQVMNHQFNLNILNTQNLTPIEYAMLLYINQQENTILFNIINELNKFIYYRNPKWVAYIYQLPLYKYNQQDVCEKSILKSLRKSTYINNIKNLNHIIIRRMIKYNKNNSLIDFLKLTNNNYNLDLVYDELFKHMNISLINELVPLFLHEDKFIYLLFKLRMFDQIETIKNQVNFNDIIKKLSEFGDYLSIAYLYKHVSHDLIKQHDEKHNNLLHIIYRSAMSETLDNYVCCFKLIIKYDASLLDEKNNDGNIPVFTTPLCGKLLNLCGITKQVNKRGDTLLHHIIRYSVQPTILLSVIDQLEDLIDYQNNDKETPLLLAVKLGKTKLCQILLRRKCNISLKDKYDNSIYHYVKKYNLILNDLPPIEKEESNIYGNTPNDYALFSN